MSDFQSFKQSFKGDLVTPSDADYADAIFRWAANAKRNAKVVAFVRDAADVALAIKYAKENKLPLAVKCGGHSPGGTSSCEGLIIDLSRHMNGVRIDSEKKLAYVGGGTLWEAVDKAAIKHELATVAGTVNHTGVAGLTLGGGYGFLSGAHGLAIDNLVQVTLVTADGSVLTVNENENPDLYFAIRGGGSNFGVCTEFVQKLHYQRPRVFGGMIVHPGTALDQVTAVTNDWWNKGLSEKEGILQVYTKSPDGHPVVVDFLFYNGTVEEGKATFKAFLDLPSVMNNTGEMPYEEVNTMNNPFTYHGRNMYMRSVYFSEMNPDSMPKVFDRICERTVDDFEVATLYEFFPLAKINSVPNGKTAFFRRPYSNTVSIAYWKEDSPEKSAYGRETVQELIKTIQASQPAACREITGYGNADSEVSSDKSKSLFRDNYERLQEIKKKYDPDLLFDRWFVIRPKD